MKEIVYHTKVNDLSDLHCRIADAVAFMTLEMLRNTYREIEYRLDILCATQEGGGGIYRDLLISQ
jgi:hypothetical protein